jgi:hypothetical protein
MAKMSKAKAKAKSKSKKPNKKKKALTIKAGGPPSAGTVPKSIK